MTLLKIKNLKFMNKFLSSFIAFGFLMLGSVHAQEIIEDQTCSFNKGDMLVLYTDGVTESQNQSNEEFGLDRLCNKLKNAKDNTPLSFNSSLMKSLEEFSSISCDRDDLTLLTVKRS